MNQNETNENEAAKVDSQALAAGLSTIFGEPKTVPVEGTDLYNHTFEVPVKAEASPTEEASPTVEEDEELFEIIDGYRVNSATGEAELITPKVFEVNDAASAEWVLQKYAEAESEKERLKLQLKGMQDRIGRLIARQEARLKGLDRRFGADLERVAKENLTGRSWITVWAECKFKKSPAKAIPVDMLKAYSYVAEKSPESARKWDKTETIYEINCSKGLLAEIAAMKPEEAAAIGFEVTPEKDCFSIKIGGSK